MLGEAQDYRVELDCYSGPLDLLLYLVRRHEIDLNNLPVALLTEQYLQHLALIPQIDVEQAGEFLVMAATLVEIKSAMLVPQPQAQDAPAPGIPGAPEAMNPLDPRYELVQQLLAYKRYKDAAEELDRRRTLWEARFPRRPARLPGERVQPHLEAAEISDESAEPAAEWVEIDIEDANVLDLCQAYARVMETVGQPPAVHELLYDDTPIALHAEDILDRLRRDGGLTLQEVFAGRASRSERIGLFLATLELVRQGKIRVIQDELEEQVALELIEPVTEGEPPPESTPQAGISQGGATM